MPIQTHVKARKEQRKLLRKKRKRQEENVIIDKKELSSRKKNWMGCSDDDILIKKIGQSNSMKQKKGKKRPSSTISLVVDPYYRHLTPAQAAAIRREDDDIADLEHKLGLRMQSSNSNPKKAKEKLNKEYAKLDGYGDDFGDFLDDLDNMMERISNGKDVQDDDEEEKDHSDDEYSSDEEPRLIHVTPESSNQIVVVPERNRETNSYAIIDTSTAALLRRDDEEIANLEKKLGLSNRKEKRKLYMEYAKLEGYGDDFGEFLDDLDDLVVRLKHPDTYKQCGLSEEACSQDESSRNDTSDGEEVVPMKGPHEEMDEDDSVLKELEGNQVEDFSGDQENKLDSNQESDQADANSSNSQSESSSCASDSEEGQAEPDHFITDTYHPSKGEDIYGNTLVTAADGETKPSMYIPPHLRKKRESDNGLDEERRCLVHRSLNNALNRLSEDTLISVAQQIAELYSSNPSQLVHEQIWRNVKGACVELPMLMTGLIPVYTACITGVHFQTGDTVQVGETILETVVVELWNRLGSWRASSSGSTDEPDSAQQKEVEGKHLCNLMLMLSYLYNYNVVHCSLMYDIIRHLIDCFSELDIECLLIILSHCGRSLRSDDPLALKEIVLMVQKKQTQNCKVESRAEYMISAITDLKNNRRKREDSVVSDKVSKFRKLLGRIKSSAAKAGISKTSSDASLRISLHDILNAEAKGRWWKVGASWIGNQYRFSEETKQRDVSETIGGDIKGGSSDKNKEDEFLLKLASMLRMNTDRKRAIFCIIMGGSDCEDTFEKLCRSSMLQNRSERDVVRVLLECCGHEKSYNKFYGYLAARICEYQPQSRFSLQLAYWDAFKQFDTMGVRKAANLAKLLFHLVITHQTLKLLPVIKVIDVTDENMTNSPLIFLTILFSAILEYFDEPFQAQALFARSKAHDDIDDTGEVPEQDDGVRAGLLVFCMETLKASPKNIKGSRFRKNLKAVIKEFDTDGFGNVTLSE